MKQAFIFLVFAWASLWFGSSCWAQGQSEATYYRGTNDAPAVPGTAHVEGENFLAGVQGNQVTVVAQSDTCGRMFYIKGTMSFPANIETGTISGTMSRCTNTVLLGPPCNHLKNYQVQFSGTVTRSRTPGGLRQLMININYYPDEKWIKENCKKARVDRGSDVIVLTDATPDVRSPTGRIIRDDIDEAEKVVIDTILKGLRQPR